MMELKLAVLYCVRERLRQLSDYLGDEEDPERWACDALLERLEELEAYAGIPGGVRLVEASGPEEVLGGTFDYGDGGTAELRAELFELHHELLTADFVIDVFRDLDALPLDGPDGDFGDK